MKTLKVIGLMHAILGKTVDSGQCRHVHAQTQTTSNPRSAESQLRQKNKELVHPLIADPSHHSFKSEIFYK